MYNALLNRVYYCTNLKEEVIDLSFSRDWCFDLANYIRDGMFFDLACHKILEKHVKFGSTVRIYTSSNRPHHREQE